MECAYSALHALPAEEFGVFRRAPRQFQHTHADHERQAAAAARRAELDQQRAAARQRVRRTAVLSILLDEDSDVFLGDADFQDEPRPASSSQQRSTGGQQPGRSHTENVRRREEAWRSCDQFDTAVSVACAEELARYAEEDVELAVSAVQRRVDALGSSPPHPCLGGPVERLGRDVLQALLVDASCFFRLQIVPGKLSGTSRTTASERDCQRELQPWIGLYKLPAGCGAAQPL